MTELIRFTPADANELQTIRYPDKMLEEIREIIGQWNTGSFQGKYFEMFAVKANGQIVGSISLYQQSVHIVSIGPEIFPPFRRCGYAAAAMRRAIEIARQNGFTMVVQQIRNDNAASIRLHRKLDFETTGKLYTNEKGNPCLFYYKVIYEEG